MSSDTVGKEASIGNFKNECLEMTIEKVKQKASQSLKVGTFVVSIISVMIPALIGIVAAISEYTSSKVSMAKDIDALEYRISMDEMRSAREIEKLRLESFQRYKKLQEAVIPIQRIEREQAVMQEKIENLKNKQEEFITDSKQFQKEMRRTLKEMLEKLSNR